MDGVTLYIDHGSATTAAALTTPDGHTEPVVLNHGPHHTAIQHANQLALGAPAEASGGRLGATSPASARVADRARVLAEVVAIASTQANQRIGRVVLVVGAHRGPQWRADLRRSAEHAGITRFECVDGAVAIAADLGRSESAPITGSRVVICDLGATAMEAAVFVRALDGYEMRSIADTSTGGDSIDAAIVAHAQPHIIGTEHARAGKHVLAHRNHARLDNGADGSPLDLDITTLGTLTAPIWDQYADTIRTAIDGADADIQDISAIYLTGGGAHLPLAAQSLRDRLDAPIIVFDNPDRAAVMAAAATDPAVSAPASTATAAAGYHVHLHEVVGIVFPVAASAALFFQFLTTATPYPETANVIAPWGDLGLAATLALIGGLVTASVITASGAGPDAQVARVRAPVVTAAAVGGLIIAVIYALVAQASIVLPAPYLRVVLLCTLPLALITIGLAHLPRLTSQPVAVERAPVSRQRTTSIAVAAVGAWAAQAGFFGTIDVTGHDQLIWPLLEHLGGAFVGAGFAILLSRRTTTLLYLIPSLALIGTLAMTYNNANTITFAYVATLALWTAVHAIPRQAPDTGGAVTAAGATAGAPEDAGAAKPVPIAVPATPATPEGRDEAGRNAASG